MYRMNRNQCWMLVIILFISSVLHSEIITKPNAKNTHHVIYEYPFIESYLGNGFRYSYQLGYRSGIGAGLSYHSFKKNDDNYIIALYKIVRINSGYEYLLYSAKGYLNLKLLVGYGNTKFTKESYKTDDTDKSHSLYLSPQLDLSFWKLSVVTSLIYDVEITESLISRDISNLRLSIGIGANL